LITIFLCISESKDAFLIGALQAFIWAGIWGFLATWSQKLVPGIEPLRVQSLD